MTIRDVLISLGFNVDESSANKAEHGVTNLKNKATKLLGAIGIGFTLVQLNALAEEFNGINDQIRQATDGMGEQKDIQQQILSAANGCKTAYGDMANTASKLMNSDKTLFGSVEEATEFVGLTTKLFKTANKSNQEISGLQEALNKSFAKGIVDTETINQLYEKAPEAIKLIADSLGVAKEKLMDMTTNGQISLAQLKNAFTSNADTINASFDNLDFSISDAMLNIRNQWGLFLDGLNSGMGISQTVARLMVRGFNQFLEVLKKGQTFVERLAQKVGGLPNLLKLVAAGAAAIFIAMNAGKIVTFITSIPKYLNIIWIAIKGIKLSTFAIIAVVMLLFLAVDDFINFMKGNDSVIGSLLEGAGIDSEKARDTIIGAWEAVKGFLSEAWEWIKTTASTIWSGLKDFWAENGESITTSLKAVWEGLSAALGAIWGAIKSVATTVFTALQDFWAKWGDKIMTAFGILWDTLSGLVMPFFDVLKNLGEFISNVFSGNWEAAWENIKNILSTVLDAIVSVITGIFEIIWTFIGDKVTAIKDAIVNAFTAARDKVAEIFAAIKETVGNVFEALVNIVKAPINAIIDLLNGLIGGMNKLSCDVPDWIPGIGGKTIGFNIPTIPKLAQGGYLKANSPRLAVVGDNPSQGEIIAPDGKILSVVLNALELFVARLKPSQAVSTMNTVSSNRSIIQNVNIQNSFTGADPQVQKKGAETMKKSGQDATEAMARALAMGR